jgi:tRNA(His) 5'-end guanylyltransferase
MQSLGDRMKRYELSYRQCLTRRVPVIIRVNGRAFHSYASGLRKPFSPILIAAIQETAKCLLEEIQNSKMAYTQSDEISILLWDFDEIDTDAWFDYEINKLASSSAAIATAYFNKIISEKYKTEKPAFFDSRAFSVPKEDVTNYFMWRSKDWERNSLSMFAKAFYSQKQLDKKCKAEVHEMLYKKGKNWADLREEYKNGTFIYKKPLIRKNARKRKYEIVKTSNIYPKYVKIESLVKQYFYL